jgi:predicted aminopeptidase
VSPIGHPTVRVRLRAALRALWGFARAWSGDSAYEAYLARPASGPRLSREAFYLDSLRRRYDGPSRCC